MNSAMIRERPDGVLLTIHVQPGAKRTEYAGLHGDALKFRVAAPPVGGAANEALCAFLAAAFGIPNRRVRLEAGAGSRRKRILLAGVTAQRVRDVLGQPRRKGDHPG
jgi:hypothetical protein